MTNISLSLPQFISIIVAILGSFTAMFWALQRYVAGQIKSSAEDISERFDTHASKLESKLDAVVQTLNELKVALTKVASDHGAKIDSLQEWIGRLEGRVGSLERNSGRT